MDPRFTLIGLIIGFLIGLTGMGGGSLMTPVMILIMGVKPVIAIGTDLAYGAITRWVGAGAHFRHGTVHRRSAYLLGTGSIPATIVGVGLVTYLRHSNPAIVDTLLLRSVAVMLIFVALVLAAKPFILARARSAGLRSGHGDFRDEIQDLGDTRPWLLPIIGAVVGFLVGLTSVGAGTIVIAALFFLYPRWESREYVGTDVFHAAMLVSASGIAQFAAGNVNLGMMTALLIGSIPGVLLGSRLAIGFPETLLRYSMVGMLILSGAQLL